MTDQQTTIANALEPAIIVVFGVTGDLAGRYLLPSLYHLFKDNLLHEHTEIVGLTRQDLTTDELFSKVELCINEKDNICDPLALKQMHEKTRLLKFDPSVGEDYSQLKQALDAIENEHGLCMNRLYYLSIPPKLFPEAVQHLGQAKLNESCQHGQAKSRLLVEKPFGSDLASAQQLIEVTNQVFSEEQVFRIDHYLAKETVQNILSFRSFNPIFQSIWNNQHIQAIEIVSREKIGIEGRKVFYEGIGALRDFVQSHLLQLLAVTTMSLPAELSSDSIHIHKQSLLQSILPADPSNAIRGQYEGYRQEAEAPESTTETFASISLVIDTSEWQGVPITVTTGKALGEKRTEIRVIFTNRGSTSDDVNQLVFRIQPDEGIHLQLRVKKPGYEHELQEAALDFSYQNTFGDSQHPNAYERVLVDAVKGDRTLFATSEEVLASWQILEPIIQAWKHNADGLQTYPFGSNGPAS